MRREHKSHVIVISFMLMIILFVFAFVIFRNPNGFGPTLTTAIPNYAQASSGVQVLNSPETTAQTEINVLIGFLILLVFLVMCWIGIKIFREFRK